VLAAAGDALVPFVEGVLQKGAWPPTSSPQHSVNRAFDQWWFTRPAGKRASAAYLAHSPPNTNRSVGRRYGALRNIRSPIRGGAAQREERGAVVARSAVRGLLWGSGAASQPFWMIIECSASRQASPVTILVLYEMSDSFSIHSFQIAPQRALEATGVRKRGEAKELQSVLNRLAAGSQVVVVLALNRHHLFEELHTRCEPFQHRAGFLRVAVAHGAFQRGVCVRGSHPVYRGARLAAHQAAI
jgi:hypothetical protein